MALFRCCCDNPPTESFFVVGGFVLSSWQAPYFHSAGRRFPVSIISADIDGLKVVNDGLGHEAGDRLLQLAAGALFDAFRAEDVVARIGGDEFGVLLPGADTSVVNEAVKRIRKNLDKINGPGGEF